MVSQFPQNHFRARFFFKRFFTGRSYDIPLIMRRIGALLAWSFCLFVLGCGGYLGTAQLAYQDGRYLEVAENLGDHEADLPRLPPEKQAIYGLYRGLSLIMLGDHDAASHWLDFAADVEKTRPGSLLPAQRRELEDARDKLAKTADMEPTSEAIALPTHPTSDAQP